MVKIPLSYNRKPGLFTRYFFRFCAHREAIAQNLRILTMDSASLSAAVTAEIERQQAR